MGAASTGPPTRLPPAAALTIMLPQVPAGGIQIPGPDGSVVNITCGTGQYVCDKGGGFSYLEGKSAGAFFAPGADGSTYPYPAQSLDNAALNGAHGNAVETFSMEQLPVATWDAGMLVSANDSKSWPRLKDTRARVCGGTTLSTHLYERRQPEVPDVLRIVRGYILTDAMKSQRHPLCH